MQRKDFKSRLFKKNIKSDDLDYWFYLIRRISLQIKTITQNSTVLVLNAGLEKTKLNHILDQIEEEGHIPPIRKKNKMTGKGDCGRRLGPVA